MAGEVDVERTKGSDGVQSYSLGFEPDGTPATGTIDCGDGPGEGPFYPPNCCVILRVYGVQQDGWLLQDSSDYSNPAEEIESSWSVSGHGPQ
jgi:hypothetical protein